MPTGPERGEKPTSARPEKTENLCNSALHTALRDRGKVLAEPHVADRDGDHPGHGTGVEDRLGQVQEPARTGCVNHDLRRGRGFDTTNSNLVIRQIDRGIHENNQPRPGNGIRQFRRQLMAGDCLNTLQVFGLDQLRHLGSHPVIAAQRVTIPDNENRTVLRCRGGAF